MKITFDQNLLHSRVEPKDFPGIKWWSVFRRALRNQTQLRNHPSLENHHHQQQQQQNQHQDGADCSFVNCRHTYYSSTRQATEYQVKIGRKKLFLQYS